MNEENNANGTAKHVEIDDWSIFMCGGETFMGKPEAIGSRWLRPVYKLTIQANVGGGQMTVNYVGMPVLMLSSLQALEMPANAIEVKFDRLHPAEVKELVGAIRQAEEMATALRAARSGLTVVPGLPSNMPRPPGMGRS